MMENIENVQEDIEVGTRSLTVDIVACVTMSTTEEFDFTCSIDEGGQIVLTPTNEEFQFNSILLCTDDEKYEGKPIYIQANMLCDSNNVQLQADIDAIGQAVIYPVDEKNSFVSASVQDSLNLITEEDSSNDASEKVPEVTAEVADDTSDVVSSLTENYTQKFGTIKCDTIDECFTCFNCLQEHYKVTFMKLREGYAVGYNKLNEEFETQDVILRFLSGKIALFSDDAEPQSSYIHIEELDTNGYTYYYDPETDAIVTYPVK